MKNNLRTWVFLVFLTCIIGCEKEDPVNSASDTIEEEGISTYDFGVSKVDLLNSRISSGISNDPTIALSSFNEENTSEINNLSEIVDRLDLDNAYFVEDSLYTTFRAAVFQQGSYRREILSWASDGFSRNFIFTYPDSTNLNEFYVSLLNGELLQKTTILPDGTSENIYYNQTGTGGTTSNSRNFNEDFCYQSFFQTCSSGLHSFADGTHGDCELWNTTDPEKYPPSAIAVAVPCGMDGGGEVEDYPPPGGSDGPSSPRLPGGAGGGDGSDGGMYDCIMGIDCSDCNLEGDIDNSCSIEPEETCLWYIGNSNFESLSQIQKDAVMNFLADNGCSGETQAFADRAINTLFEDGEVDFENELIISKSFKNTDAYCVLQLLNSDTNNYLLSVISQFTSGNERTRLVFDYAPIRTITGAIDTDTEANTSPPDPYGFITITFNSNIVTSANNNTLVLAARILHESIHAQLFDIIQSGNNSENPLDPDQYNYMLGLYEFWQNNGSPMFVSASAQHSFMVYFHIQPVAQAVRNLDNNLYNLDHYLAFAWEGLEETGYNTQPQILTPTQMSNYINLSQTPLNDNQNLLCD